MKDIEKQIKTFGMPYKDVFADFKEVKDKYEEAGATYIMGILSDAQEEIQLGNNVQANQFINKAKILISTGRY